MGRFNKGRKSFDEILLEKYLEIPDWINEGINSVMKSSSDLNRQSVGYSFKDNLVKAYVIKENHGFVDVDLQISMLHFKLGVISKGHDGNGEYINGEKIYK